MKSFIIDLSNNDNQYTNLLEDLHNNENPERNLYLIMTGCIIENVKISDNVILSLTIKSESEKLLDSIQKVCSIPSTKTNQEINFYGLNVLDFLGKIYDGKILKINYIDTIGYTEYLNLLKVETVLPKMRVFKTDPNAVIPSKTRASDVGYDITVIKKHKQINSVTTLYDTGIRVKLDLGYYCQIYPRSSLVKSGYILTNSVGIIDPGYTNNIYIALTKINPDSPDPELPFRCCQFVINKQIHTEVIEEKDSFEETDRNIGGFGSTGK